jgi:hypothetical protein
MRSCLTSLALVTLCSPALAQGLPLETSAASDPIALPEDASAPLPLVVASGPESQRGPLTGNRNFPNFIGFMSNPLQNIDPRALTQIWPMFGSVWTTASPPLPPTDFQLLGPGLNVALSERLSFGLNQGGYAWVQVDRRDPAGILRDLQQARLLSNQDRLRVLDRLRREGRLNNLGPAGLLPDLEREGLLRNPVRARILQNLNQVGLLNQEDGDRDGWLNLGGFVQYTLIQDVEQQFLLTAGLRWEAPAGTNEVFQGRGPAYLAPYLTVGKELGCYHVLATAGYQFPAAFGTTTHDFFYANLHLDRKSFGWVYPLVEFNWTYHTTNVDVDLPTQQGFIDFGNFTGSGNILVLAAGANLVLVQDRLELGAVYTTPLASQRDFDFEGLLVKMVLRY